MTGQLERWDPRRAVPIPKSTNAVGVDATFSRGCRDARVDYDWLAEPSCLADNHAEAVEAVPSRSRTEGQDRPCGSPARPPGLQDGAPRGARGQGSLPTRAGGARASCPPPRPPGRGCALGSRRGPGSRRWSPRQLGLAARRHPRARASPPEGFLPARGRGPVARWRARTTARPPTSANGGESRKRHRAARSRLSLSRAATTPSPTGAFAWTTPACGSADECSPAALAAPEHCTGPPRRAAPQVRAVRAGAACPSVGRR